MFSELGFSYKKATQAINYFANKDGGSIDKLKVLKLIYLSDRYHLRKYGRTITNDQYFAMDYGPVASATKDILQLSDFLNENEIKYATLYISRITNNLIKAEKDTDLTELSSSDKEALDYVWENFGSIEKFDLAELTHKYPEWKKHERSLEDGFTSRFKMDIEDFFDDPDYDIDKLYELDNKEKEARIEHLKELNLIESLWE